MAETAPDMVDTTVLTNRLGSGEARRWLDGKSRTFVGRGEGMANRRLKPSILRPCYNAGACMRESHEGRKEIRAKISNQILYM